MAPPDDFGLSPIETLAHVGERVPAPLHGPFWVRWREAVGACRPRLDPADPPDPSDPTATHRFESVGSVRLGCRLELPPRGTPAVAGLVTTHGYASPEPLADAARRWKAVAARGVAVLAVRVRGYPGSRLDTGDWSAEPGSLGWVTRGFPATPNRPEDLLGWSLPQGVADVACAVRALGQWLRSRAGAPGDGAGAPPVFLHGESFGGGLAVMATAQMPWEWARVERLVLGLPTFGDWAWRFADPARLALGSGAELARLFRSLGEEGTARALEVLRVCDAAVHASEVRAAALCKLALRDEVVPAPAAAAVCNALGTDPGRKWRFLVGEGHTEPSVAEGRRLALFERCAADFLDPGVEPREAMAAWAGAMEAALREEGDGGPLTGAQSGLFGEEPTRDRSGEVLIEAYRRAGRTLDDLPYTAEWAGLFAEAGPATGLREREVFHRLHNLRKAGKLPRMGRAASTPPRITAEEEADLASRVRGLVGSLGQRDQLPFTPEFDRLVREFNEATGRGLDPHDIWRLIAKLAK